MRSSWACIVLGSEVVIPLVMSVSVFLVAISFGGRAEISSVVLGLVLMAIDALDMLCEQSGCERLEGDVSG
jgi:hypothetical protein